MMSSISEEFKPVVEVKKIIEELEKDYSRFLVAKALFDKEKEEKAEAVRVELELYYLKLVNNASAIVLTFNKKYKDFIDKNFINEYREKSYGEEFEKFDRNKDYLYACIELNLKNSHFAEPVYSGASVNFLKTLKYKNPAKDSLYIVIEEFVGESPQRQFCHETIKDDLEDKLLEQIERLNRLSNLFIYEEEIKCYIFDYSTQIEKEILTVTLDKRII